jgi:hypothetical protein
MARGLYRDQQGAVMVQYDKHQARIPRGEYVDDAYHPPYDELPTLEKYNEAQDEKCLASSRISLDTGTAIATAERERMMDVNEWLVRWASDNMHEGYIDTQASIEQAAADCRSAAEEAGISLSSLDAAADGDLAAYLRDFKDNILDSPGGD